VLKTETNNNSRIPPDLESGFRTLLNTLPFGVQLIDSDHTIVAVNDALKQTLEMEEDQLIGKHCTVVIHGLNAPPADCPLEESRQSGKLVDRELFDAAHERWINASIYPTSIVTTDGKQTYLHFLRDITESKHTSAELSKSLEHHKALCDLLQNLQNSRNSHQILNILIDRVLSLSWLGMAASAVGFLVNGKDLEMVAQRNAPPDLIRNCCRIAPGECLCGKAFETGRSFICSSDSHNHNIRLEGMEEHHHAILPIRHTNETLGVLTLYLNPEEKMDDFRLGFLEAATAAAGAAIDAQLARERALKTKERALAHIISSHENDRKRVAEALHEKLSQSLSAILLELHSKEEHLIDPESALPGIKSHLRELIDQVLKMAGQLRPAILDDFGLQSALGREIEEISGLQEIQIDYQCIPSAAETDRFPKPAEVGLYRVAMEALVNAISHAEALHISVILMRQKNKVTLLIEDDGKGFDYRAIRKEIEKCKGLIEMEERIIVLGGKFEIESVPQQGTTVRAEVPLDIAAETA